MDITSLAAGKSAASERKSSRWTGRFFRAAVPGLRLKLMVLVVSISLLIILAAAFLFFTLESQQLTHLAEKSASALSSTVETSLRHAMPGGNQAMLAEIVAALAAENTFSSLRLLDIQGVVGVSSLPGEVGKSFALADPICQQCHRGGSPATEKTQIYTNSAGQQMLLSVNMIENAAECHACHRPEANALGLLVIEMPLASLNDQVSDAFRRIGLLATVMVALLVGLLLLALNRNVIRPVEELTRGVESISTGDLARPVPVLHRDELGDLADSFNRMRQQLILSQSEMERSNQELAVLNEVSSTVNQSLDLQEVLDVALEAVTSKLKVEVGMIRLLDEETGLFKLRAATGAAPELLAEIERRRQDPDYDISRETAEAGKPYFVANIDDDRRTRGLFEDPDGRSFLSVLLMSKGKMVGTLSVVSHAGHPIPERSVETINAVGNEIGIAIDNARLLAEAQSREQEAVALYELGIKISSSIAFGDVLHTVAEAAREILTADAGLVGLMNEERRAVIMLGCSGIPKDAVQGLHMTLDEESPGSALSRGIPIFAEVYDNQHLLFSSEEAIPAAEQIISVLAVPLLRGERFLGVIEVMARGQRRFQQPEAQLLLRLAQKVAVSIENAQLYKQLRYLATLEERDRLARELHDQLAQTLGYLNVRAAMTEELLSGGQVEQAQASLLEMKKVTRFIYTDVREAIFNLRTATTPQMGLLPTLQEYLAQYRSHYGVDARLAPCSKKLLENAEVVDFPPETASQVLCIIQEALTNVRKHAAASQVAIHCIEEEDWVSIRIEDDGRGFTPPESGEQSQHYGLQIMRERAASFGGGLDFVSEPGRGTSVIVRVPKPSG